MSPRHAFAHRGSVVLRAGLVAAVAALASGGAPARAADPADPPGAIGTALAPDRPLAEVGCAHTLTCPIGYFVNGEAFAGPGFVWQTDFFIAEVDLVDVSRCRVVDRIRVPMGSPSENAYDGRYLYHYNYGTGLIYQIDPDTHQILAHCDAPGDDLAEGLAWDGEALWKGDSQHLYRFSPPPNCQVLQVLPNPPGDSADGLGFCGRWLVLLGYSGRLYQIDPANGAVVGSCLVQLGSSGNGLDTDGISQVFADFHGGGTDHLDRVDLDCSMPVPVHGPTWGATKVRYR